jgi:hypothetical protein
VKFIRNLAKAHSLHIEIKELHDGLRAYVMGNVVYLDKSMSPERMNFAFCHELAHRVLGHNEIDILSEEMERDANTLAAEFLLPPETFRKDAPIHPLNKLKELYPQASWEVIARSRLALVPAVLTIFDNGKRTLRTASENFNYPPQLLSIENETLKRCMERCQHVEMQEYPVRTYGYYVDTGEGVVRVLLWTEFDG